jgi:NAD(P)H dehydrogenase (quinone)
MCRTSEQFLVDYGQRLQYLSDDQPLVFPKLAEFDERLYPLHQTAAKDA